MTSETKMTQAELETQAFKEGVAANNRGQRMDANPYDMTSKQDKLRTAWRAGWMAQNFAMR